MPHLDPFLSQQGFSSARLLQDGVWLHLAGRYLALASLEKLSVRGHRAA